MLGRALLLFRGVVLGRSGSAAFAPPHGGPVSRQRLLTVSSVSGVAWEVDDSRPRVQLYTKAGCTLCDEAKSILAACRDTSPHSLELVDITDADKVEWWHRYKYDIPVLHVDGAYWAKHRITLDQVRAALQTAAQLRDRDEPFPASRGQPDASRLERS
mmetsp:Transcript_13579/g.42873  ORF Transcript_13579/g.42873 Transcript_13579/m.42873 type:complete len:158 (-) Transcript_13579:114-587(-)